MISANKKTLFQTALFKTALFQTVVAVSILALVLALVIMNFAANRTLSRVTHDLRETHRQTLTNAILQVSSHIEEYSDSLSLSEALAVAVSNEDLDYAFIVDSGLNELASAPVDVFGVTREVIHELALSDEGAVKFSQNKFQFTYLRPSSSEWEVFHCPLAYEGEWEILVIARRTTILAALERDAHNLLFSGVVIVVLLSFGVFAFFRGVTRPIKRISDSVAEVGASSGDAESAVDELVSRYKETITQLRSKEASLLELNEGLEGRIGDIERFNSSLLGAMSTGVVFIDSQGRLLGINDKALSYLGDPVSSVSSVSAKSASEDYVGLFAEYPLIKARVEQVLLDATCDTSDFEYEKECADGGVKTYRVSLMSLLKENNELRELMLLISDQTEVVRAQKRLEDSRQLATLGEMSAGLAHQLRNSLSAAMGFSSLVKRKAEKSDMQGSIGPLNSLLKELQDEATLVDRFLSFSKPLALDTDLASLSEFLNDSLASYKAKPDLSSRVQLSVGEDGLADLDALLLKQVVGNLVDNALRASEAKGSPVDISASVSEDKVEIMISDYGSGISASEQKRIFTPFYSSSPSGAGLGLPLARKIVELHGGALELVSRPDCGATFTIELPRYQSTGPCVREGHLKSAQPS